MVQKPHFWAMFGPNRPKRFFWKNELFTYLTHCNSISLYKKSEKSYELIFHRVRKTIFGHFWAQIGPYAKAAEPIIFAITVKSC